MSMTGLEYLAAVTRGEMPDAPITRTLAFRLAEFSFGRAVFQGTPERFLYNPIGSVHGGWAATLLDSAMGCAIHSTLPAGRSYTTVDLSITFTRPITEHIKLVRCEGNVLHSGGSIATAQGKILDEAGILYATGTTTCLILSPR
jgi:uncharacterized protein (TIGR00369 family)